MEPEKGRYATLDRNGYAQISDETPCGNIATQKEASSSWREIPRDRIVLGKTLGEGEFGMVIKGELAEDDGRITHCAVKTLKRT